MDDKKKGWVYPLIGFLVAFLIFFIFSQVLLEFDLFISIIVGAVFGLFAAFAIKQNMPSPGMKEFAEEMGLNYHGSIVGTNFIDGDYRNHYVRVNYDYVTDKYNDDSGHDITDFEVKLLNASGISMYISKEGIMGKLKKKMGAQDIEIGDPEFDRKFIIKGNSKTDIQFILDPSIQKKIASLKHLSSINLDNTEVSMEFDGSISDKILIKKFLDATVDIAEKAEGT